MSSFTEKLEYTEVGKDKKGRKLYRLEKSITYKVGSEIDPFWSITVPEGFITDLATIFWPARLIFKPDGKYAAAAILHDYMIHQYEVMRGETFTRIVIDAIFYEALLVLKTNFIVASLFYYSVRLYARLVGKI